MLTTIVAEIDRCNEILGKLLSWCTFFMVLVMCFNVFGRYVLGESTIWQQELVGYLHVFAFMGAAGYTYMRNEHVRVDVLYHHFSERGKALVDIIGVLLLLWPLCVLMVAFSIKFVLNSWAILEGSPEYGGLPGVYLLKSFIWIFAGSLFLQGVSVVGHSLETLRKS